MTPSIQVSPRLDEEVSMGDFRKLEAWQEAHQLTLDVYRITRGFPREELFGLVSQVRGAAASVGSNIAEGTGRNNNGDFARSLSIASGSASELLYLMILSRDLEYITDDTLTHRAERSCRIVFGLLKSVQRDRGLLRRR
jgi:four helix bundle protein